MVEQLRRWKRIALVALTSLVLVIAGWTYTAVMQARQLREALERVEQIGQEAAQSREEATEAGKELEKAKAHAEMLLYFSRLQAAQNEFLDRTDGSERPKKP